MKIEDKTTAEKDAARRKNLHTSLYQRDQNSLNNENKISYIMLTWLKHPVLSFKRWYVLRQARDPNSVYNKDKTCSTSTK